MVSKDKTLSPINEKAAFSTAFSCCPGRKFAEKSELCYDIFGTGRLHQARREFTMCIEDRRKGAQYEKERKAAGGTGFSHVYGSGADCLRKR